MGRPAVQVVRAPGRGLSEAEAEERRTKVFGAPNGALGNVGLELLRAMGDEPARAWTIAELCTGTARSTDAVRAAIGRLRARGYLL